MNRLPEDPKFVVVVTSLQKVLAGIALSMWLVVWAMGWSVSVSIFQPDYVKALTLFRVVLALIAFGVTSLVSYRQIKIGLNRLVSLWEMYKRIKDLKDKDE